MPNIRELQRRLSQWATDHKEERYRDLMNLVCNPEWLYQAYRNVAGNKGAQTPGVDGLTLRKWEENSEARMEKLRTSLCTGKYRPQPTRRVYIPKKDGKRRPLGITTFRDKIVQEAIRMAIEPIFEADFHPYSFGFRPNRSTHDAKAAVRTYMMNRRRMYYVIEGDIKGYFDTVQHKKLMRLIKRRIADKRVLNLIWLFLKAGVMEEGLYKDTNRGVPQGGVISPLLSNIYLHELDRYIAGRFLGKTPSQQNKNRKLGKGNAGYVRYADDWLFFYNGHVQDVRQLKVEFANFLQNELHLTLSPEKTLITHVNDGFEFLGFRFYRGVAGDGGWKHKTAIPQNKVRAVKDKVKALTESNRIYMNESAVISNINRVLRGWGNYYRHVPASKTFNAIDHYVFNRVVRWYRLKYKWTWRQVIKRRYICAGRDKRLFAEWDGPEGRKRVHLLCLVRDVRFSKYFHRKKDNPFLAEHPNTH